VFHVSQLRKYVYDASHVIQVDDLEVRDNLTVETWPVRIEDREVKRLRGMEIVLVKVIWVGPTSESATWESESRMKVSYPELFPSGNFRGRKFFLEGESCNSPIFRYIYFIIYLIVFMCICMCSYVIICLCVYFVGICRIRC
jgi:hypothetical protein